MTFSAEITGDLFTFPEDSTDFFLNSVEILCIEPRALAFLVFCLANTS